MKKPLTTLFLMLLTLSAVAQVSTGLLTSLTAIAGMRERLPVEKLYVQLDKPYYSLGDTLRFKAYLLKADFLKPSLKSGIMYIELDDAANKMAVRISVPLVSGIGWGNMALDEKEIPEGSYTLRAYTNWMLNFGEDYIFKKNIYISPVNSGATLVKAAYKLDGGADKTKVTAALQLTGLNGEPLRLKDMRLRVSKGYGWLFNDKLNTGMDGTMHLSFNLADKTALNKLTIQIQNAGKDTDTATMLIPVILNRPEKTDVQFMPEGGNMVAGIPIKIGFKAISEDGKAIEITGKILNSKQQEVAEFKSTHKGMGTFELLPQTGETYVAKVSTPNNTTISYPLPAVSATGTSLKIVPKGKDSLEVTLSATAGMLNASTNYYLIGETRGVVCYTALISFKGAVVKKVIAKDLFPAGIAHFTLLNSANQALNERIVYVARNENLHINITASKLDYATRDSIAVAIAVKDKNGKPMRGSFSLAVTDDSQVSTDSVNNNMISNLLLTSDLKGNVEEPGWYFQKDTPERITALDNLLLTQGWVGYDWKAIFNPIVQQPQYRAEPEFVVQGTLTNVFNKPLKQTRVALLQKRPLITKDVLTNDEGRFVFKGLFPTDSAFYMVEVKNKNGDNKDFNIGVEVDEFVPPEFIMPKERQLPWYFNSDTTLLKNVGSKIAELKAEANYNGEGRVLKEVIIKAQKIIPESHNLNGAGGADIILDEKEMNKEKNKTLSELLEDKLPNISVYEIVIDGIFIASYNMDVYMDGLKASDIKGIEVMTTSGYSSTYAIAMSRVRNLGKFPRTDPKVFLEITTYSGHGAFLKNTPGRFIYRPVPLNLPKEFYSPKYTVNNKNIAMGTDLRSTIYWAPNVVTDKDGKATVSFYSADKPAGYTMIMEGTDMNGNLGYSRTKISISKKHQTR